MSIHLTESEVDDLCKPLQQRAAQRRFIEQVLKLPVLGARPDGLPLVGRNSAESRFSSTHPLTSPSRGFNWSK